MFSVKHNPFSFLNRDGKNITLGEALNDVDVYSEDIDKLEAILTGDFNPGGRTLIQIFDYSDVENALDVLSSFGEVEEEQIDLMRGLISKYNDHVWIVEYGY